MNKPSAEEIRKEIEILKEIKLKVLRSNYFNEDNHSAIDAQITALEGLFGDDEVYKKWEDPQDYEYNRNIINNALETVAWMNGEAEDGSPSENWKSLIK
jgi:hypothetical protein